MMDQGTGADRQLEVYNQRQDLADVVDYVHSQFLVV